MTGIKPDRRQVVRAGIWTVPAIAVATTAPAYAASAADMSGPLTTYTRVGTSKNPFTARLNVSNSGGATTQGLVVRITISDLAPQGSQPAAPSGWTIQPYTTGNTIVYKKNGEMPGGTTEGPFDFVVARLNSGSGTATIVVDPGSPGTSKTFGPITL